MTENCTVIGVAPPPQPTNDGDTVEQAFVTKSVRGFLDQPRRAQLLALANKISDASAVLMAPMSLLPELVPQARVRVRLDEVGIQSPMQVLHTINRVKDGGLSHVEVYLKGL